MFIWIGFLLWLEWNSRTHISEKKLGINGNSFRKSRMAEWKGRQAYSVANIYCCIYIMDMSCCVKGLTTRGHSSLWLQVLPSRSTPPSRGLLRHYTMGSSRQQVALDLAGCHCLRLQAGRGGGGKGAVHDGTQGLMGPESLCQQALLLRQRIHLKTNQKAESSSLFIDEDLSCIFTVQIKSTLV